MSKLARKCPTGCGRTASALEIMCRPCWRTLTEQEEKAFLTVFERYKASPADPSLLLAMREARRALISAVRGHVTLQLKLGG